VDDGRGTVLPVHADGGIELTSYGVRLTGNRLDAGDARDIADLFGHHDSLEDEPMPPIAADDRHAGLLDAAGAVVPDEVEQREGEGGGGSVLPLSDRAYLSRAATTTEDLEALAPRLPPPVAERILALDPELDLDLSGWRDPSSPRPKLRVLGPVELRVNRDMPADVAARLAYDTEILTYLATRPHGATPDQIAADFNCGNRNIHSRIGEIRKWLGKDPETDEWYLPEAVHSQAAIQRGVAVYQATRILFDADLFRRLRGRAQARGADGLDDLVAALHLVEGRPFDQLRRNGYAWLAEDPLHHHLTAAVVDAAHVVATHSLTVGDLVLSRWAAERAILAGPMEDKPRFDLAAVMTAEGDADRADRYLNDWLQATGGGPLDFDTRTHYLAPRSDTGQS